MRKRIVIVGWYNHRSVGDDLFEHAFRKLLPDHDLYFADHIDDKTKGDMLIFGGGSFLDAPINAKHHASDAKAPTFSEPIFGNYLGDPKAAPIVYVGVGAEGIHPDHEILLRHAKLIALRSNTNIEAVKALNPNTIVIPDLVYSLTHTTPSPERNRAQQKTVLLCPNVSVVPKYDDAHWKHDAWNHFKFEYSQFLDAIIQEGHAIEYLEMCTDRQHIDAYAITEVQNLMHKGHLIRDVYYASFEGIQELVDLFARYGTVISQRFHGMVVSEMARTPYVGIYHHDKLRSTTLDEGVFLEYYATSKSSLINAFNLASTQKLRPDLAIDQHLFDDLKGRLTTLLE